jgi:hypothetical protein
LIASLTQDGSRKAVGVAIGLDLMGQGVLGRAIAQATGLAISEANEQLQGLQGGLWGEQAMGRSVRLEGMEDDQ